MMPKQAEFEQITNFELVRSRSVGTHPTAKSGMLLKKQPPKKVKHSFK